MTGFTDLSCTCCAADGINFQKTVILTSLFIYIGGYQVGFGPISWLLISEIFPLEVRGKAVSIAVVTNFFWNTLMTFFFPIELQFIGSASTFYLYAIILTSGIYFIHKKVPETKGMSLEEIEDFFMKSSQTKVLGTNPIIQRRGDYTIDKHAENYKLSPLI
jgi:MFS family permease